MTLVTVRRNPPTAVDRFASSAFASQIGKVLPMTFAGQVVVGSATLVTVEVAADGSHALLTFDLEIPRTSCCRLHNPAGCCDPEDCGPCCENCPTCPVLIRQRRAGVTFPSAAGTASHAT